MSDNKIPENQSKISNPGDGIKSIRTTSIFRAINFELYAKPNAVIMTVGVICFASVLGYIAYMRSKYEGTHYSALQPDGTEVYAKKKSKWD